MILHRFTKEAWSLGLGDREGDRLNGEYVKLYLRKYKSSNRNNWVGSPGDSLLTEGMEKKIIFTE